MEQPGTAVRLRPTMRDVAALAGVALKTVSRVMNDVPTVDAQLALRVRDAADKLGYRPNLTASFLRRTGGRTGTIGLLVEDVGNPFSAAVHRAVEAVARTRDVLLLTGSLNEDADRERHLVRTLVDRRADGLIVVPGGQDYRWVVAEQEAGTAFVFVDRVPSPLIADAVLSDSHAAASVGLRHLIAHGHRRIAYLGDEPSIQTARARHDAFRELAATGTVEADPALERLGLRTIEQARAATLDLLTTVVPTAIFASQNVVLIGAVQALHQLGRQHRVALVGLDELELAAQVDPPITVIAQDPAAIGRIAAERLFARLDGDRGPAVVFDVPTRLVVRGSGEIGPASGSA